MALTFGRTGKASDPASKGDPPLATGQGLGRDCNIPDSQSRVAEPCPQAMELSIAVAGLSQSHVFGEARYPTCPLRGGYIRSWMNAPSGTLWPTAFSIEQANGAS